MPSPPDEYPKDRRPGSVFALKYIRAISDEAVASRVGANGYVLLSIVAVMEDVVRYRPVTFSESQLADRMGCDRRTLQRSRKACVDEGLLHYDAGTRIRKSVYWVLWPDDLGRNSPDGSAELRQNSPDGAGRDLGKKSAKIPQMDGSNCGKNAQNFPTIIPHTHDSHPYKPHEGENEASKKLRGKRPKETRRSLLGISVEELKDTSAILRRIEALQNDGVLPATEADTLNAVAAAVRALERADRPPALFVSLVRERNWGGLSDADVDAARRRLAEHRRAAGGPASALVADLAARFALPPSASPEVTE
jgi:hypothetical protein